MFGLLKTIFLVVAVLLVILLLKKFADKNTLENFDERQVFYRQKAYANAAFAAICFNTFIFIEGDSIAKYLSLSFVGVANIFLVTGVFAITSIFYDAYFASGNKKGLLLVFCIGSLLQVPIVIMQILTGKYFNQGHLYLTERATSLITVITFGTILLATIYKKWKEKKEEEE